MFKGKALLVIDRLENTRASEFCWDIHACIQTLNREDHGGEVDEMFGCMAYDLVPAPAAAYNMAVGDRIRVSVAFEIHYTFYMDEHDAELYLLREKVLRYQKYKYKKYSPKPYKTPNR